VATDQAAYHIYWNQTGVPREGLPLHDQRLREAEKVPQNLIRLMPA